MNPTRLAFRSFLHFWRSNFSIALGVAAATAVLTGALIVGDSMRGSLRDLTLERLAGVDEVLRGRSFFRQQLAEEIAATESFQANYELAIPAIMLPESTAQIGEGENAMQVVSVTLFGCTEPFWQLDNSVNRPSRTPSDQEIVINQTLANDLGMGDFNANEPPTISVRLPVQGRIAADSPLGEKQQLVEFIGDLKVIDVIDDRGLGRFSMYPTQLPPRNAFLSLELLQEILGPREFKNKPDFNQVNVIFLQGKDKNAPPEAETTTALEHSIRPKLIDLDLRTDRVTQWFKPNDERRQKAFDYFTISSDQLLVPRSLATAIDQAFDDAKPVFTYLANEIQVTNRETGNLPIPFSLVTGIDFDSTFAPISSRSGKPIEPLEDHQIVLNEWAATKLGAEINDQITLKYFEPETADGKEIEVSQQFELVDIARVQTPGSARFVWMSVVGGRLPLFIFSPQIENSRRFSIKPVFYQMPSIANDPLLTPFVPGLTDAESTRDLNLPFKTPGAERDDEYFQAFGTTPKAFVNLAISHELWQSRFGSTTSYRLQIRGRDQEQVEEILLSNIVEQGGEAGLNIVPVKRHGLDASAGSTPFDALFLSLSMFVIVAALLLVSILFRLSLQQRSHQIGILSAVGLGHGKVVRIWTIEMTLVSLVGTILGIALGIGYAAVMLYGLRTWWVGAITTPFIELHIGWLSILIGAAAGGVVSLLTIWFSLWQSRKQSVLAMLSGRIESSQRPGTRGGRKLLFAGAVFFLVALILTFSATQLAGESQAGAFLGSGFCILTGLLIFVWNGLKTRSGQRGSSSLDIRRLAFGNARRNPLRSTLTIGLVASASFLIVSISAFRLAPSDRGTGGFDWLATTERPVFEDLNNPETQRTGILQVELEKSSLILPMRLKSGEDASCNNPYQSTQPRVIGVSDQMIEHFDQPESSGRKSFGWAGSSAKTEQDRANPWRLLRTELDANLIPVVIDKNTAWYSLKVYFVGSEFEVEFDTGEKAKFKVVGFLDNTILQGSLIIGEDHFRDLFKESSGYRMFLMNLDRANDLRDSDQFIIQNRLSDYGLDLQSTRELLRGYLAVQNTYLTTFQALGALGLLLGTFGLAAVQMRSVLERKQELAVMRAIGFNQYRLGQYISLETIMLLILGLAIGAIAATFVTLPHALATQISFPWLESGIMFAMIFTVGLVAALLSARWISKVPILAALRN